MIVINEFICIIWVADEFLLSIVYPIHFVRPILNGPFTKGPLVSGIYNQIDQTGWNIHKKWIQTTIYQQTIRLLDFHFLAYWIHLNFLHLMGFVPNGLKISWICFTFMLYIDYVCFIFYVVKTGSIYFWNKKYRPVTCLNAR